MSYLRSIWDWSVEMIGSALFLIAYLIAGFFDWVYSVGSEE